MPAINEGAARTAFKSKGRTVGVPSHYAVGHTMDENDVRFANRQLASVLLNVLASALSRKVGDAIEANVKARLGEGATAEAIKAEVAKATDAEKDAALAAISDADVQAAFDKIYTNYTIGQTVVRDGSSLHDPVQSIANNMAWEKVKELLKKRKIRVNSVKAEKKAQLIADYLKRDPSIMESAKAVFGSTSPTIPDDMFAGLEVDTTPAPAGDNTVEGGAGNDSVAGDASTVAGSEPETVGGGDGNDSVAASDPASTVEGGQGEDTVSGGDNAAPAADTPSDGNAVASPGAVNSGADPAEGASESIPGQDNPGSSEVAPDASAGEKTPPGGAFA